MFVLEIHAQPMNFVMMGRAIQMPKVMAISEFNQYAFYFFVCFELVRLAILWLLEKLVIVLEICAQMMNFVIMKFVIQVITISKLNLLFTVSHFWEEDSKPNARDVRKLI